MRDQDIRCQLNKTVMADYRRCRDTIVVEEFDIFRKARIDIAVINGELVGYEIKSPRDTLKRLAQQAVLYGSVFDRVTLVVGECHFESALACVPPWWGILVVAGDQLVMDHYRDSSLNKGVEASALVKLLWRSEALDLLNQFGVASGVKSKPRKYVWERLAAEVSLETLQAEVRSILRGRQDWRVRQSSFRCDG